MLHELDQLKGMAMKVGQILSYLDVGLPEEVTRHLEGLQRGVQPVDFDTVLPVLEAQLGRPLDEAFDRFDREAVAAASIGQVHRAAVDGREVAVKIRYPGIAEALSADLRQLAVIGRLASLGVAVDGPALVRDLQAHLLRECDYALEARWQATFRQRVGNGSFVVPEVIGSHCAEGVLTTAWHETVPAADLPPEQQAEWVQALARFPLRALFGHGVLHADPHPGNLVADAAGQLVVFDFGCVHAFTEGQVEVQRELVVALRSGSVARFREAAVAAGLAPDPDRTDFEALQSLQRWQWEPFFSPRFHFRRSWWEAGMREHSRPTNPALRTMGFPPEQIWIQRVILGLHAVLVRLDAHASVGENFDDAVALPLRPVAVPSSGGNPG